jgi:hypothetical protein
MKTGIAVVLTMLLCAVLAHAAGNMTADQGAPGKQGGWGVVDGSHGACTNTTLVIGTSGVACPTTARADRKTLMIQLTQTGETVNITTDGTTTATASAGISVADGSAYTDNLAGTVAANCRCTAASCQLRIVECP